MAQTNKQCVIHYFDRQGNEIGTYHTHEAASERRAWEAWLNDPATDRPVDEEWQETFDSHDIDQWDITLE